MNWIVIEAYRFAQIFWVKIFIDTNAFLNNIISFYVIVSNAEGN